MLCLAGRLKLARGMDLVPGDSYRDQTSAPSVSRCQRRRSSH